VSSRLILLTFVIFLYAGNASGAAVRRQLASSAAGCIVIDKQKWLPREIYARAYINVAAIEDSSSYPGERHLVIVVMRGDRSGEVFDTRLQREGGKQKFTIENNADFKATGKLITFNNPPLGGVWTQDYLKRSINKSLVSRHWKLAVKSLQQPQVNILCRSYVSETLRNQQ